MKKIQFVGLGALVAAAAAVPYLIKKKHQKKAEEAAYYCHTPEDDGTRDTVDFKDADHLIFCDESLLGRRLIQLDNTINMRDIGGYTGLDGRKTKWGKVIRSEELAHLSDDDVTYLADMGLKHVFDFRDAGKAERTPDRLPATADYTNINILKGIPLDHSTLDFDQPDAIDGFMRGIYAYQVDQKAQAFAEVLHLMTDPTQYPILYHCTNGKDRTGILTALILLICGVSEETIISDYTLTNLTFDEAFETLGSIMADELEEKTNVSKDKLREFFGVKPAWLQIVLDYIRDHYENVDAYLMDKTDLTASDLDAIRDNMLEEA